MPPPPMTMREMAFYAFNMHLEELRQKLEEAEDEWGRCDGSAGIDRLTAAFYNRIYLKQTFDKMQQDRDLFAL